ncbi:MAG: hypothetical protein CMJ70_19705 [Planctomycetaceae bacterium]|nr:hypothetical protein [Planctomycetaceae bacterium]HAA73458.1 hypothetical protein [Planctomycetaceae bacterium]
MRIVAGQVKTVTSEMCEPCDWGGFQQPPGVNSEIPDSTYRKRAGKTRENNAPVPCGLDSFTRLRTATTFSAWYNR